MKSGRWDMRCQLCWVWEVEVDERAVGVGIDPDLGLDVGW